MKRLLTAGSGSIFQIAKAFRRGEFGEKHNPEFTLLEWYKVSVSVLDFMKELEDLLVSLLSSSAFIYTTYQEAFIREIGLDPFNLEREKFRAFCSEKKNIPPFEVTNSEDLDEQRQYLMAFFVEPGLGKHAPEYITHYPKSQAALAKTNEDNLTARRFELFYKGVELCNGFDELLCPKEYLKRFNAENLKRVKMGKERYEIDSHFISALNKGLPPCVGAALGIERLLMLKLRKTHINEVLVFPYSEA